MRKARVERVRMTMSRKCRIIHSRLVWDRPADMVDGLSFVPVK
jgi:hypothetical protein